MGLTFLNPYYLWFLLLIPLFYYTYRKLISKRKLAAMKFSNLGLIKAAGGGRRSGWRKHIMFYLSMFALLFLIISLADPHIPLKRTKQGVNVVLALDVSGSMQATDYSPNRLEAAKSSAEILLKSLNPKDHAGIVIFETGATTSAYISPFKDKVISKLKGISPREGRTAIGDGLSLAVDMAISIPNKKKVVILLSDGVSNAGVISPQEAVQFAKTNDIQVYAIGMGSDEPTVLGYDWYGRPQYAELDEATLKYIAEQTGGEYFKSVDKNTLDQIYGGLSEKLKREKEPTSIKDFFIFLSLIIIGIEFYIQYGKYRVIQ